MRADKTKSRTTWASLLCLASAGCVQHQHGSISKGPLPSSQSGRGWQQAGLTSNTGRMAVVNDPSQWPERPSSESVKSQFNELFPNLAQRQGGAARVQIGSPQPVEEVAAAPAEKPAEPADNLPQVVEAKPQPQPEPRPQSPAVQPMESRQLARLAQQSAGAISAVAAMVSMPDEATVKASADAGPEPSVGPKPETVVAGKAPEISPESHLAKPELKPESLPHLNVADAPAGQREPAGEVAKIAPELPAVPSIPKEAAQPESVSANPIQAPTNQNVIDDKPVASVEPPLAQPEPVLAEKLPEVPAIPNSAVSAGQTVVKHNELKELSGKGPSPTADLPGLNSVKAAEPVETVAAAPLTDRLEPPAPLPVVPAIPMAPVLTSIPEQASPVAQPVVAETLPPPLTAEEVLARKNLKTTNAAAPAAESAPALLTDAKPPTDLPADIPSIPAIASEVAKKQDLTAKLPVAAPVDSAAPHRLAMVPAESAKAAALQTGADQTPTADKPLGVEDVPQKLPVDVPQPVLKKEVKPDAAAPAAVSESAPKPAIDLPPPAPAPELQVPGLPEPLKPPAEHAVEKPRVAASADQGVERSSADQPIESKPAPVTVETAPEAAPAKAVEAEIKPDLPSASGPEAKVPVLTPLPDDQATRGPFSSGQRSREIVIRLMIPKPSLRKLFTLKSQPEGGVQSLRSATAGLFDWRKRLSPGFQQQAHAIVPQTSLAAQNDVTPSVDTGSVAPAETVAVDGSSEVPKPLLAVEPYQPSARVAQNGLPPVTFPSSYRQKASANPWANHQSPAVNLVAAPPTPAPNPQPSVKQEITLESAKPNRTVVQRSSDTAIVPISYAALSQPAAPSPSPTPAPVAAGQLESRSWISSAQKGLRSIWGGSDEVVPPRRQDWASRVAAVQESGPSPRAITSSGDRTSAESVSQKRFKPLRAPEN